VIKRITNKSDFKKVLDDLLDLFDFENENEAHHFLRYNKEYIYNAFSDEALLTWNFFLWANINVDNKFDAMIAFVNNRSEKYGEEIFSEYIWLSKQSSMGYKLLATALKFAKEKEFKYVTMNRVMKHPKSDKVARFYEKMGFVKDTETYIAKI
tara:strand:+ start:385 stop:843 length:459 start_codon:yes stop_codon:yes gene_type:complete